MNPPPEPPDLDHTPAPERRQTDEREWIETLLIREIVHEPTPAVVLDAVSSADFATGANRRIWEKVEQVHRDGQPISFETVYDALAADGQVRHVGGMDHLVHTLTSWGFSGTARYYAEKLHDMARRERMAAVGRQLAARAVAGDIDMEEVQRALQPELPDHDRGIERPWDVIEQITDRHANPDAQAGVRLGWRALDGLYRVDPGLLTIMTGIPGSGKSSLLDAAMVRLAEIEGWRFAVFSPESAPTDRHVLSLASVHAGRSSGTLAVAELHLEVEWVHQHFTWIKSTDSVTLDEVIRRADIIRRQDGINGLVIDPWNELADQRSDSVTETQHISHSLTKIRRWGRRHGIHIWVIAHPKKMDKRTDGTYPAPSLYDISGSATWYDKADMGVVVHRDKLNPGPVAVQVVKVRFSQHGRVGVGQLHFDVPSGRYFDVAPNGFGEAA